MIFLFKWQFLTVCITKSLLCSIIYSLHHRLIKTNQGVNFGSIGNWKTINLGQWKSTQTDCTGTDPQGVTGPISLDMAKKTALMFYQDSIRVGNEMISSKLMSLKEGIETISTKLPSLEESVAMMSAQGLLLESSTKEFYKSLEILLKSGSSFFQTLSWLVENDKRQLLKLVQSENIDPMFKYESITVCEKLASEENIVSISDLCSALKGRKFNNMLKKAYLAKNNASPKQLRRQLQNICHVK